MGKLWTILTHLHSLAGYVQFIFTASDFFFFASFIWFCRASVFSLLLIQL